VYHVTRYFSEVETLERKPWQGVLVANPLSFDQDLEIDLSHYGEHIAWLAASGCDGITPNGSLGEYQTLTREERSRVLEAAVAAAPPGFAVIPGVAAYGSREAVYWTEQAARAGAPAVMLLPPNAYRADQQGVVEHFRAVAAVGLPVIAYNNPIDTKVDLVPELLARLFAEGLIVAVKEFAGDPRRGYAIRELAPELDVLIGSDDTVLEFAVAGAKGWVSGYTNAFPRSCVQLYQAAMDGEIDQAGLLYGRLHALLRWDSKTEFVQAIKLSMDLVGRFGGPCRPPRGPLSAENSALIRELTERAIADGLT
jgi:dihydrodipicolinate synthase/N-acetylneuraminate lyase